MKNINLKLLQTFVLVAEHGSFRRAAEESMRTPSAVSMQIKSLEDQVGVALFIRSTRRVELTLEGRMLLQRVRRSLDDLNDGLEELRATASARRGIVTLASSPTIAATRLPPILVDFQKRFPQTVVRVREMQLHETIDAVRTETVDFGLAPWMAGQPSVQFDKLFDDPLYAVVPRGHALARRRTVALAALAEYPMVVLTNMAALRFSVDDAVANLGLSLDIRYEALQPQTVIALVGAGLGVAVLPGIMVPLLTGPICAIPLSEPALYRTLSIITRAGHRPSLLAGELMALIAHRMVGPD